MQNDWNQFIGAFSDVECERIIREHQHQITDRDSLLHKKTAEWCMPRVFYIDNRISDNITLACYDRMYNKYKTLASEMKSSW